MSLSYNAWLVGLSFLIASLASFTALELVRRVQTTDRLAALCWWGTGAVTLGTGIWSMHFVGMLALVLPLELGYAYGLTALSWLCAVAVSALALGLVATGRLTGLRLYGGALAMAAGICGMHYIGMLAMSIVPAIRWSPGLVAASVVIAAVSSWLALRMFARVRRVGERREPVWQVGASGVMALGITGMHYSGMAAASFDAGSVCLSAERLHGEGLFALIAGVTLLLLLIILLMTALDRRLSQHRDRLEVEVAERTAELREALVAAQHAAAAKTQFLAAMSHELRTPLTSICGFAALIEGCSQEPATREQAGYIRSGADRLNALLSDILDLTQIDAGALALKPERIEVEALLQAVVKPFAPQAQKRGLTLEVTVAPGCPDHVVGDARRITQILHHLLSNALKFSREGGVRVVAERERGGQGQREWLLIHVDDTGPGIPAHQQALVFERFRQADARVSFQHGGTGLGLALSRSLATWMHGRLTLHSEPGQGCRFSLALPLAG